MVEEEQRLCLVEPTLELLEEMLLQVQMQLMEEMQDMEALEAEEDVEALVEMVILVELLLVLLVIGQQQMQVAVEREVMEVAAEEGAKEDGLLLSPLYGQG